MLFGIPALAILSLLAIPVFRLDTGMPSIKVVPKGDGSRVGYAQVQEAFGPGAPGTLQIVVGGGRRGAASQAVLDGRPGHRRASRPRGARAAGRSSSPSPPPTRPIPRSARRSTGSARRSRPARSSAARPRRTTTSRRRSPRRRCPSSLVVLGLGFLLLLVALQAPLIALAGVLTNLLATGAAFGVGDLVFQDGHLQGLLGFESQGFLDAWGPVFFFAMIFAISMDYTVFLLSSAKEHWDRSHDPREAMVGGLAHSGRTIFAAAAVMVAVFFTFALSGPLPPKEMGVILGVAVLLDAMLIRLVLMPVLLRLHRAATPGRCRAGSTGCCRTSPSATRRRIAAWPTPSSTPATSSGIRAARATRGSRPSCPSR